MASGRSLLPFSAAAQHMQCSPFNNLMLSIKMHIQTAVTECNWSLIVLTSDPASQDKPKWYRYRTET
jgi:hypothetical protein